MKNFAYNSKKLFLFAMVLFFVIFASGSAFAEDSLPKAGEATASSATTSEAKTSKTDTKVINFDDDDTIDGASIAPEGEFVNSQQHERLGQYFKIPNNFSDELLTSITNI